MFEVSLKFGGRARDKPDKRSVPSVNILSASDFADAIKSNGYRRLIDCPEIYAAIARIAELVSSMTIYLMENQDIGDVRLRDDGLARLVDIAPNDLMTRKEFIYAIVVSMLSTGNAIVLPKTGNGYIKSLDYQPANSYILTPTVDRSVRLSIGGREYKPDQYLRFPYGTTANSPLVGEGIKAPLSDILACLSQAEQTKKSFLKSKWQPSIIISYDGIADELSDEEGRDRLLNKYVANSEAGKPWMLPAELLKIDTVKPLTLQDLAINETVTIEKKAAAAVIGVPPYMVGAGEFNRNEYNAFIQSIIMSITRTIEQTLTKGLLLSPKRYFKFNLRSLYSYDLPQTASMMQDMYVRGIVTGNEVRDAVGMTPCEGLDERVILENYIPAAMIGDQKKLKGGDKDDK